MFQPSELTSLINNIRMRKLHGHRSYHLLLGPTNREEDLREGYRHLVWLLKKGYLATVLTLIDDTLLQDTLSAANVEARIVEINKDASQDIEDALEGADSTPCIIRLPLLSNSPSALRLIDLSTSIQDSLKTFFQNTVVVVGSLERSSLVIELLHTISKPSIYYVLPEKPGVNDLLEQRRQEPDSNIFLIYGPYGLFNPFFTRLVSSMNLDSSVDPAPQTHSIPITPSKKISLQKVQRREKMNIDVLLTTITLVETRAVLYLFPHHQEFVIENKHYYDLGSMNDLQIVLMRATHMGSHTPGGSRASTEKALSALSPRYVIMVGIAFGIKAEKQRIGDILVSEQIQDYELQRVSRGPNNERIIEARGERVSASLHLLDLFKAAEHKFSTVWPVDPPGIEFGLILSGSKLIDHENFREDLRGIAPDAIGGEMEGIGLYQAAKERNVHWILVKAICDWADGNKGVQKEERQQLAARNAAQFVYHVLQRGGFESHRTKKRS